MPMRRRRGGQRGRHRIRVTSATHRGKYGAARPRTTNDDITRARDARYAEEQMMCAARRARDTPKEREKEIYMFCTMQYPESRSG